MSIPSGLGSLMIRNLRKPADYAKAVMTQDELLKVAISNDANIAKARQEVRLGVPPPVPASNLKSAEEIALDVGKMESDALSNVLQLGFTYDEAARIVNSLSQDEMFKLNRSYPSLEREFKVKYDVKLITPTFFVDFLKKYFEELDASKGVASGFGLGYVKDKFDELIDTTRELRAVIPTKDQISSLESVMSQAFSDLPSVITLPIMERLEILNNLLPDGELYSKLDDLQRQDQALAYKLNQELQNALQGLPSREQVERVLMDIQDRRISNEDSLKRIEMIVNDMDASQTQQLAQITSLIRQVETEIKTGKYVEGDLKAAAYREIGDEVVPFGILSLDNKTIVLITAEGEKIKMDKAGLDNYNKIIVSRGFPNPKLAVSTLREYINTNSDPALVDASNKGEFATTETAFEGSMMTGTTTESIPYAKARSVFSPAVKGQKGQQGQEKHGLGISKTLAKNSATKIKVPKCKVGVGLSNKKEPPYRQLGKYVIHWKQLNDNDMLNVKYKSLGRIPQFKPIPVSDVFKDYLVDVMESGKHNQRHYESVPVEERKVWEKIINGAGLAEQLKIKKTKSNDDEKEMERFEMLKGQYINGNNNPNVIRELRRFVVKFLGDGRLKRNQALDLLLELSI